MRPCHSFLRREGVLGIGHHVVFLFRWCISFAISAIYATDDFGRGTREVISNLNGSFGYQYFPSVVNGRTTFASCARAFQSSGLVISLKWTSNQKVAYVFVSFEWNKWRLRKDSATVSGSFWSSLKFVRIMDLTAWLWEWNMRVNRTRSDFSFCGDCSADCRSISWARWWPAWTTETG